MGVDQSLVPIVDLLQPEGLPADPQRIVAAMADALEHHGFMYLRGHSLGPRVESAFEMSRRFFALDHATKMRSRYQQIDANFGYQGLEIESLDPTNAPDLKETFTMRNAPALPAEDARWPDVAFRTQAVDFYQAALAQVHGLLALMAQALDLPQQFFTPLHRGENVTLRYLHYPAGVAQRDQRQLGAGEHTDYGSITLLFQDEVGGLEVCGRDGRWIAAPPIPGCAVINTGDLMERWTNGRFRSTPHRVRPIAGARDRYSIALFVDPDSDTRVECIPSCVDAGHPARYPPVTAGEHLHRRIAATHEAGGKRLPHR
ncbi:MAG TPA: 2OG-Fe(II) oxygenase family protein [Steroidobacteraceae bacterium]|nr:2OG-Fe(II) oxygenase family protein [Steroidobacteraceae bacterium]